MQLPQKKETVGAISRVRTPLCASLIALMSLYNAAPSRGQVGREGSRASEKMPKVNPDGWTSAAVCGECHQAIHAVWQEALHAHSWSNGVFQAAYRRSIDSYGPEQARLCLSCHAPTVRHSKDYAVKDPITAEGVTCDFCHSVKAVDLSAPTDRAELIVGGAKYGPLRHAQSPVHDVVNSELHTRSEFCAGCHEYQNPNGLKVLSTYSEWKESSYAKRGIQCQDCHMPAIPGRVVALSVKGDTATSVNLHNISGSHDIERVRNAIVMELVGYEWITNRVRVYVEVANKGSGHCFPTGLPMHRAVLEVTVRDGPREVGRREIAFEVVMVDKQGRPLRREHEVHVRAARVRSDTRLKPDEARTIEISFPDIEAPRLVVTATLYYEYSTETLVVREDGEEFKPVKMKFLLASCQQNMKPLGH